MRARLIRMRSMEVSFLRGGLGVRVGVMLTSQS